MPNDTDDAPARGIHHKADGSVEMVSTPDRYLVRVDHEGDVVTLDDEIEISGHVSYGFTLSGPFTPAKVHTVTDSRVRRDGRPDVDLHALLARAQETGERRFRTSDFEIRV